MSWSWRPETFGQQAGEPVKKEVQLNLPLKARRPVKSVILVLGHRMGSQCAVISRGVWKSNNQELWCPRIAKFDVPAQEESKFCFFSFLKNLFGQDLSGKMMPTHSSESISSLLSLLIQILMSSSNPQIELIFYYLSGHPLTLSSWNKIYLHN